MVEYTPGYFVMFSTEHQGLYSDEATPSKENNWVRNIFSIPKSRNADPLTERPFLRLSSISSITIKS